MKKIISLTLVILTLTSFVTLSNNSFTELVKEKLIKYITEDAPEKIYLHTDKPYYSLGEDIWFTGYLVDGIVHQANPKSYILHVELINERDSIVRKKKLFTADVTIPSDFEIDKDWNEGTYLLRAYTNYMRNGDPDYFFQKKIPILSPKKNDELENKSITIATEQKNLILEKPILSFYPEGGDLIENINCVVAFKIKNDLYSDMTIKGTILDENNNLVSQFSASKFGLGKFTFTPEPNKSYIANIEINGSEYSYPLPKALPNGEQLSIINNGTNIYIKVKSNLPTGLNQTYLVGHQRGQLIVDKFETTNTNEYLVKLVTSNLTDGIIHFTLFNASGNPVCERLAFIENKKNEVSVEIQKDKNILGTKEQLKVNLNVKDFEGNSLPSHLSMSVMDLNAFPHNKNSENIKTWLLLNSDLRGKIKDPGYFFNEEENINKRRFLLDLVMLTNGWRRFTWKNLLYEEKTKNKFTIEKGIYISGSTKSLEPPYTITPALSRLTFFTPPFEQEPIQKSTDGKFSFGPYVFSDSIPILLESRLVSFTLEDPKFRELAIILDKESESPEVLRIKNNSNVLEETKNEAFLKISRYMDEIKREFDEKRQQLDEIVINAKKEELENIREKQMNERADYGEPTHRLDLESKPMFGVQTAYDLIARMPGVAAFSDGITIRGRNPKILIDNLPVDADFMKSVFSDDVSFIDMLTGPATSMFSDAGGGIIAVYTKTQYGINTRIKRKPGVINFTAKGFYTARTFSAPNYLEPLDEFKQADIRTTLHWEPEIKIDENGSKEVSFFTSEVKGNYLIEIEGISKSGLPFYKTDTFTVE